MPRVAKPFEFYTRREDECLVWTGAKNSSGYGSVREGGKPRKAHHVAYERSFGKLPVSGSGSQTFVVMHKCDNRLCVNPDHLKLGTQKENIQDAIEKKRVPHISGGETRPSRRKFSWEDAISYWKQGVAVQDMERFFNTKATSIYKALKKGGYSNFA